MQYEFLILSSDGSLAAFKEVPATWGNAEVEPTFSFIPFDGTEEEANYILGYCKWDGTNFLHKVIAEPFDAAMIIGTEEFPDKLEKARQTLVELTGDETATVNDYPDRQRPEYQDKWTTAEKETYWQNLFLPWRHVEEVAAMLRALNGGCIGYSYPRIKLIPAETMEEILEAMPSVDSDWLIEKWGMIGNN